MVIRNSKHSISYINKIKENDFKTVPRKRKKKILMPINFLMKVGIFLINRSSYSVQYTFTNKIQKKKKMHRDRPMQVKRNVPGAIPERMGDREGECGVILGNNVGFF